MVAVAGAEDDIAEGVRGRPNEPAAHPHDPKEMKVLAHPDAANDATSGEPGAVEDGAAIYRARVKERLAALDAAKERVPRQTEPARRNKLRIARNALGKLFAAAALICFVLDIVSFVTLEQRLCKGPPTVSDYNYCAQGVDTGDMACHARPSQCAGRYAWFAEHNVHFSDFVVPNLSEISVLGYLKFGLSLVGAAALNVVHFVGYVVMQPLIKNPLLVFILWQLLRLFILFVRAAGEDAAPSYSVPEKLLSQRSTPSAGPASRAKIHAALSAKSSPAERRFKD